MSRGKPLLPRADSDSPPPRLSQWSFSVLTLPLVIYMMARELSPECVRGRGGLHRLEPAEHALRTRRCPSTAGCRSANPETLTLTLTPQP